ncbi:MAG: DNA-binding response regulator [Magnetococcales bacterium]|nr:DNA-binding response regulator [Magnetococcales bacterium]
MNTIIGKAELLLFRSHWTAKRILELNQKYPQMLINWGVGVGKSYNIDQVIKYAIEYDYFDLVIFFSPTRAIIDERIWIQNPPSQYRVINLRPRPVERCSPKLNQVWEPIEQNGMGLFGKQILCKLKCKVLDTCYWPQQYGKSLESVNVIYATQTHIERNPWFPNQLIEWVGAKRPLVILDESNFIMAITKRHITINAIDMFLDTMEHFTHIGNTETHQRWLYMLRLIRVASANDLRYAGWVFPTITIDWALAVQKKGYELFGSKFIFIAYQLQLFGYSPLESRGRDDNCDIHFSVSPKIDANFIIYSGSINPEFAKHRLGIDFATPFIDYRFSHPETRWYNISSSIGTKSSFPRNLPQILDFFAFLVAQRLEEGRRPLLVTKKCFVDKCVLELQNRIEELGLNDVLVIPGGEYDQKVECDYGIIVPIIHYGMIGTNQFEEFDCAYCLNGFYVNEKAVNSILQDLYATDLHVPIRISTGGHPRRRSAQVKNFKDRFYNINQLAPLALEHLEVGTVVQAVGRVRPFTKPREIITFQCGAIPDVEYDQEFSSLKEAREFFKIPSRQKVNLNNRISLIQEAKADGLLQREVAEKLGIGLRTVKRYWNIENSSHASK